SYLLYRDKKHFYPVLIKARGNYLWYLVDGNTLVKVFDICGGAAVSVIGHKNARVILAIKLQLDTGVTYGSPSVFTTIPAIELSNELIKTTNFKMSKVILSGSGSEAMEISLKLARHFFVINGELSRVNIISRANSYHGCTIGALSTSGHTGRKAPYGPLLMKNVHHISDCNPYR
ncbi:pyridoxal phosphate-dependent transferase, partial [Amylocarpus encephaloides]